MNLVYFGYFNSYHVEYCMSHQQRQRYLKILKEIKEKENSISPTSDAEYNNITSEDLLNGNNIDNLNIPSNN